MSSLVPSTAHATNSYRLGFSTLGCGDLSFAGVLELAQRHGLSAVEVRCLEGAPLEPDRFATTLPAPTASRDALTRAGCRTVVFGTSIKLFQATAADLETAVAFARLADELRCPWLRIFDGGQADTLPSPAAIAQVVTWWQRWQDVRRDLRLQADICVETHDGLVRCDALAALLRALPELNLLWDAHHTWRAGESLSAFHALAAPAIRHIHAKDSINRPSKRKPFTYCAPGSGEFPWTRFRELLENSGYRGCVSFEWERHWNPELAPLETVLPDFIREMRGD